MYRCLCKSRFFYLAREDYDNALKHFQKVVELEPNNPEALNNIGYVYERIDRFRSAKLMYKRALELNTGNIEALINIAHVLELEGNYSGQLNSTKE
ncbi:MAG: tetratricopeptide repeat protein [Candidatus Scalinduaceae bacterium]